MWYDKKKDIDISETSMWYRLEPKHRRDKLTALSQIWLDGRWNSVSGEHDKTDVNECRYGR